MGGDHCHHHLHLDQVEALAEVEENLPEESSVEYPLLVRVCITMSLHNWERGQDILMEAITQGRERVSAMMTMTKRVLDTRINTLVMFPHLDFLVHHILKTEMEVRAAGTAKEVSW